MVFSHSYFLFWINLVLLPWHMLTPGFVHRWEWSGKTDLNQGSLSLWRHKPSFQIPQKTKQLNINCHFASMASTADLLHVIHLQTKFLFWRLLLIFTFIMEILIFVLCCLNILLPTSSQKYFSGVLQCHSNGANLWNVDVSSCQTA